jgi:hypothetical protein
MSQLTKKRSSIAGNEQSEKFKRAAQELGSDEDEHVFEERLRKIAKKKPKHS